MADRVVDLAADQREIEISVEFSDETYEAEVLAATGLEAAAQLGMELVVDGSDVFLTFPNNAAWRGSWVWGDAAGVDAIMGGIAVDLDPLGATGPLNEASEGWLDTALGSRHPPSRGPTRDLDRRGDLALHLPMTPGSDVQPTRSSDTTSTDCLRERGCCRPHVRRDCHLGPRAGI